MNKFVCALLLGVSFAVTSLVFAQTDTGNDTSVLVSPPVLGQGSINQGSSSGGATVNSPPQFSTNACLGKAKGNVCTMSSPSGNSLPGICNYASNKGNLYCQYQAEWIPPQFAIVACQGLAVGNACTLSSSNNVSRSGICQFTTSNTYLYCKFVAQNGPAQVTINACQGMAEGDNCTKTLNNNTTKPGICVYTSDLKTLFCR